MKLTGRVWKYGANVDTDAIIAARYLDVHDGAELAKHAMEDMDPDFAAGVKPGDIIVATTNFGCGSSREHAPWALLDYGFKAVISSRFADIFRSNALKNGLLPVQVDEAVAQRLLARPDSEVRIDIVSRELTAEGIGTMEFPIDSFSAYCLTRGIDQLDFILENEAAISRYEQQHGN